MSQFSDIDMSNSDLLLKISQITDILKNESQDNIISVIFAVANNLNVLIKVEVEDLDAPVAFEQENNKPIENFPEQDSLMESAPGIDSGDSEIFEMDFYDAQEELTAPDVSAGQVQVQNSFVIQPTSLVPLSRRKADNDPVVIRYQASVIESTLQDIIQLKCLNREVFEASVMYKIMALAKSATAGLVDYGFNLVPVVSCHEEMEDISLRDAMLYCHDQDVHYQNMKDLAMAYRNIVAFNMYRLVHEYCLRYYPYESFPKGRSKTFKALFSGIDSKIINRMTRMSMYGSSLQALIDSFGSDTIILFPYIVNRSKVDHMSRFGWDKMACQLRDKNMYDVSRATINQLHKKLYP
ncbi:hypothetical protein J3Q64DRAFT_1737989 [Phycomyces blakesleeanus]|uniref:Uncharacterized protein n=1 Tax=Phycomyces blakesleeanus TaxID=4837 RepID=A0ABR3B1V8_PHYBL